MPHLDPKRSRSGLPRRPLQRRIAIKLAALLRWLHIYTSMLGLAAILFFSVTGLTLNHPDWFFANTSRSTQTEGMLDPSLLQPGDWQEEIFRLKIVERLRTDHGVRGALTDFRVDDSECNLTFKGPGYDADVLIDRGSGQYQLQETRMGVVAILNDLHKGRDTGPAWSLVIDLSAILMSIVSITGLALLFYLKMRRVRGVLVALLGGLLALAVVWLWVP